MKLRKREIQLINGMFDDIMEGLKESKFAADATSGTWFVVELFKNIREKWYKNWADMEREVAPKLGRKADIRTRRLIQRKMREYGLTIKKDFSDKQKEAINEIVRRDIEASKAIPMRIAEAVQKAVVRSYTEGRDWDYLTKEMERLREMEHDRAKLEARDRMNRTTQEVAVVNAKELGATRGRWIHVPGYHSARESHLKMDGKLFDLQVGMYDSYIGRYVKPGELKYCNCTFVPIFPGFEE